MLLGAAFAASAADPAPEIARAPGKPQAVGVAHTLRTIPEACARLEGAFTGDAAQPYRFAAVRTSPNCQPRARFVDAAKAKPSVAAGWVLNDVIRVPSAACFTQHAQVQVWRRAGQGAPPALDGQGRSRVYLQDAKQQAAADRTPPVPMFAAQLSIEGKSCGS
ncbi:MAG TPA: hypothetical protein VIG68_03935 [Lysobacter sp.]